MKVREIMTSNPACCTPDMSLEQVAGMMVECDCGAIPVVESMESGSPIGVITDRDIVIRTLGEGRNPMECTVRDAMSSNAVTIKADSDVEEAARMMADRQIRRLIVMDGSSAILGMLAQADVARSTSDSLKGEMVEQISEPVGGSLRREHA